MISPLSLLVPLSPHFKFSRVPRSAPFSSLPRSASPPFRDPLLPLRTPRSPRSLLTLPARSRHSSLLVPRFPRSPAPRSPRSTLPLSTFSSHSLISPTSSSRSSRSALFRAFYDFRALPTFLFPIVLRALPTLLFPRSVLPDPRFPAFRVLLVHSLRALPLFSFRFLHILRVLLIQRRSSHSSFTHSARSPSPLIVRPSFRILIISRATHSSFPALRALRFLLTHHSSSPRSHTPHSPRSSTP